MRFIALFLFLLSVSSSPLAAAPLKIVASNYPLAFAAQEIVKGRGKVAQIIPHGAEPHEFRPSPKQVLALHQADLVLFNGPAFEPWIGRIEEDLKASKLVTAHLFEEQGLENEHHDHHHGDFDPHFWLDPLSLKRFAQTLATRLGSLDPEGKEEYQRNLARLNERIDLLHEEFEKGLLQCELKRILVDHDAFGYLAKRYRFQTRSIRGLSPNERPSPKKLAQLQALARNEGLKVIFFEGLVSPSYAKLIAEETGARVMPLHPLGSLTLDQAQAGADYFQVMRENLTNLREARRCP